MPSEDSHGYRMQREVAPGSTVVLLADFGPDNDPKLLADDVVTVMSYSNAGFQGILAHVRDAQGRDVYNVPAGRLALYDMASERRRRLLDLTAEEVEPDILAMTDAEVLAELNRQEAEAGR